MIADAENGERRKEGREEEHKRCRLLFPRSTLEPHLGALMLASFGLLNHNSEETRKVDLVSESHIIPPHMYLASHSHSLLASSSISPLKVRPSRIELSPRPLWRQKILSASSGYSRSPSAKRKEQRHL